MKKLGTLIRLKKREMDTLRQKLAQLEGKRDALIEQIEQLSQQLIEEYKMASDLPDMRGFFGDFSGSIKKRQQVLAAHVLQAEKQIQELMQEVQAQYSELKKYEIAKERFDAEEALQARRKEQAMMDEIGIRNANFNAS